MSLPVGISSCIQCLSPADQHHGPADEARTPEKSLSKKTSLHFMTRSWRLCLPGSTWQVARSSIANREGSPLSNAIVSAFRSASISSLDEVAPQLSFVSLLRQKIRKHLPDSLRHLFNGILPLFCDIPNRSRETPRLPRNRLSFFSIRLVQSGIDLVSSPLKQQAFQQARKR